MSTSKLDHILWSKCLDKYVCDGGVMHLTENRSRHSPVWIKLNVGEIYIRKEDIKMEEKVSWRHSSDDGKFKFKNDLQNYLDNLYVPYETIHCRNSRCDNQLHFDALENFTEYMINAINRAANDNLAIIHNKSTKKKALYPGWKTMVEPYKGQADFWNFLWLEAGKPTSGEIFSIMKSTKSQYHYAVRRCKNAALKLKEDKLVKCLLSGDTDLFNEVRKSRNFRKECASIIDGKLGAENISNHLKKQYENLYNQQKSELDMRNLLNNLNEQISDSDILAVNSISENLVKDIIKSKIKPNKADEL